MLVQVTLKQGAACLRHLPAMELDEHSFLEDLLSLGMTEFFPCEGGFDCCFQEQQQLVPPGFPAFGPTATAALPVEPNFDCLSEVYCPAYTAAAAPEIQSASVRSTLDEGGLAYGEGPSASQVEAPLVLGFSDERTKKKKKKNKVEGMPSKNLMAERRRRKRLNDRLSMLRSVVPKISKMDRTSILGDTIDYMKELLDRIKLFQEEMDAGPDQGNLLSVFNELKSGEVLAKNSPKFDVERRDNDTRIEICCAAKPALLLSTVNTLEAMGLETQQCVVSCFSDFRMQASCSETREQRAVISDEEIKQALFRSAGYGGRCL